MEVTKTKGLSPCVNAGCVSSSDHSLPVFEMLEPRLLLDGALPEFATDLASGYVIEAGGGALTIGIDGYDADSDALTITAATANPNITYFASYDTAQPARLAQLHFVTSDGVTPVGDIVIQLLEGFDGDSTGAVDRFVTLSTNYVNGDGTLDPGGTPFYTDVVVHRIIDEFMIQTGDAANGDGTGDSPLGDLADSFDPYLSFIGTGVAAFANAGAGTSNSQFFITETPTTWLDGGYMIFGQVISGWDTLAVLSEYPTDALNRPLDPPILDYVAITESQQDGSLTFVADSGFSGYAEVTVTIEDGDGNSVSQVITMSPPMTMSNVPAEMTVFPGESYSFTPTFTNHEGGTLQVQYETDNPAADGYVSIDPITHEVTISIPSNTTTPEFAVDLTASLVDYGNSSDVGSAFTVLVAGDLPEIENPGMLNIAPGETHSFVANITEDSPRAVDVAISSSNPEVQVSIDPVTHEVQITAPTDFSGAYAVTLSAVEQGFDGRAPATSTFYVFTSPAYEPQGVAQFLGPDLAQASGTVQLDDVLYVTRNDTNIGSGRLDTYDVSDPTNPVYLDSYTTVRFAWDIEVINTTRNGDPVTIAFVAVLYSGVVVFDVTNPSDITQLTQFAVGDTSDSYPDVTVGLEVHNGYLYISNWEDGLEVYDVSNLDSLSNITNVGRVKELAVGFELLYVVDFVASGNYGYVVDAIGGFSVLDITDPANIAYVTSYGTGGSPWDAEIQDDVLYVIDEISGLSTFSLVAPASPALMGSTDTATISWARLAVSNNIAALTVENGFVFVDVSNPYDLVNTYEFAGPSSGKAPTFFGDFAALPLTEDGVFILDAGNIINSITFNGRRTFNLGDGTSATVKIGGDGTGRVTPADGGLSDWDLFEVFGSTDRSSVSIATKGGDLVIDDIVAYGSLRSFTAKTTDLLGDMTVEGSLGKLTLRNVADDHTITIGPSANPKATFTAKFASVTDLSILSLIPIKSITALEWLDGGTISAPLIGKIKIKAGDFEADIDSDGPIKSVDVKGGNVTGEISASSLGKLSIKGGNFSGTLDIDDFIGSIKVSSSKNKVTRLYEGGSITDAASITVNGKDSKGNSIKSISTKGGAWDGHADVLGSIGKMSIKGGVSGTISALSVGSISATGDFFPQMSLGTDAKGYAIKSLSVKGDFGAFIESLNGHIGKMKIKGDMHGWTAVYSVGTVSVSGNVYQNDLAVFKPTDDGSYALKKFTVKGWMEDSRIYSEQGDIGAITVAGIGSSNIYVGTDVDPWGEALPDPDTDFIFEAGIKSFKVKGMKGQPFSFVNTNIAAAHLGKISIRYAEFDNTVGGDAFGLAALTLDKLTYRDDDIKYTWPNKVDLDAPSPPPGNLEIRLA